MGVTNFPNGLSSFGVPLMGGGVRVPFTTGTYFFVDSGTGDDTYNDGLTVSTPLATIYAAIGKCTANAGDVISVFPGHAETIAAATSLVVDVAGISIIGLGQGDNRPVLTFSATASRIPVSADDVVIENLKFYSNIADVVSGVTVTGDNVVIRGGLWAGSAANKEFLQMLDLDAALNAVVEENEFRASTTAGTNNAIRVDVSHGAIIRNNRIKGDFTTAAVSGNAGSAAASTDLSVYGNRIQNVDTTAGLTIDMHDDSTGDIGPNWLFTLFATAPETAFDPGDCECVENYVVNAVNESGTICPTTLST